MSDKTDIRGILKKAASEYGCAAAEILPLTPERCSAVSEEFADNDLSAFPGYISETARFRADPLELFPWAQSVISAAIPFASLPDSDAVFPKAETAEFAGKIAGYAMKKDYHSAGRKIIEKLVKKLRKVTEIAFRAEICIDTAPVAERIIAKFAKTGIQGKNMNILIPGFGSGCFLVEIFTNIKNIDPTVYEETHSPCGGCCRCVRSCPAGALTDDSHFNCARCISYLTMEKRGLLTMEERKLTGDWIFGCDGCTACCPGTLLPHAFSIDLKRLLEIPTSELKRMIRGTALEYAGPTLLRRNALAVLGNRKTQAADELIQRFASKTGSSLLRETAESILTCR